MKVTDWIEACGAGGDGHLLSASGNAVARDIRLANILIIRQARPDPRNRGCST